MEEICPGDFKIRVLPRVDLREAAYDPSKVLKVMKGSSQE